MIQEGGSSQGDSNDKPNVRWKYYYCHYGGHIIRSKSFLNLILLLIISDPVVGYHTSASQCIGGDVNQLTLGYFCFIFLCLEANWTGISTFLRMFEIHLHPCMGPLHTVSHIQFVFMHAHIYTAPPYPALFVLKCIILQ